MDIIKSILGEADEERKKKKKKPEETEKSGKAEKAEDKAPKPPAPDHEEGVSAGDSAIDELANLWTTGNRDEVVRRFMDMNNETAVKVVFAIGREGSLELARMVDDMVEQGNTEEPGGEGIEPLSVEPPQDHVRDIIGGGAEPYIMGGQPGGEAQFRRDRSSSDMGPVVRRSLGMGE